MCLSNVTTTEPLIAEEDITVYKYIEKASILVNNWKELVNHGDECIAVIGNDTVNGKISIDSSGELFISAEDMGYNSWVFDKMVTSIIIKGKEIVEQGYRTRYQYTKVVIGEEYTSELICNYIDVYIGLHSYINKPELSIYYNIVECIIPKGSKYFIGNFKGIKDSIASDKLKYVKIIN